MLLTYCHFLFRWVSGLSLLLCTMPTWAAEIDGRQLSLIWTIPFVATLLAIALGPLLVARFWHSHYGKVVGLLAVSFLAPFAFLYGVEAALTSVVHVLLTEYLPFVILLTALFTAAGGICVHGNLHGRPALNVGILALGTLLASVMGTTGAAMLLVRPLIRANDNRKHVTHILVFFIFLVANIGGALTPLGDPPLFLGFLQGVDFFWPMKKIWPHTLLLVSALLAIFYVLDLYYFHQREEERPPFMDPSPDSAIRVEGKRNFFILSAIVALVLLSGLWKSGVQWTLLGTPVTLHNLVRDIGLLVLTILSVKITPSSARAGNQFSWEPMIEVGKLFAGIFLTIIPVIAILRAGYQGGFSPLLTIIYDEHGVANTAMFFWVTGLLSAFLDNAPTYLVFFNLAGGDAKLLMAQYAPVLISISTAAVFMGALTYVGNAPNLMVRAIAVHRGIKMPGFFGYMLWSISILLPLFMLLTYLFF